MVCRRAVGRHQALDPQSIDENQLLIRNRKDCSVLTMPPANGDAVNHLRMTRKRSCQKTMCLLVPCSLSFLLAQISGTSANTLPFVIGWNVFWS